MSNIQKMKQKIVDNRHTIAAVAFVGSIVTLAVILDYQVAKQQQEEKAEFNKFLVEQNRAGKTVFQLADGSYIGVAV